MGKRRRARALALKFLFQQDINKNRFENHKDELDLFWQLHPAGAELKEFANLLIQGTLKNLEKIDLLINKYTWHWNIDRMGVVDRNILRYSIYELMYIKNVPTKVTINEAIEIAKIYGSEDSGRFINGILDKISKHLKSKAKDHDSTQPGKSDFHYI